MRRRPLGLFVALVLLAGAGCSADSGSVDESSNGGWVLRELAEYLPLADADDRFVYGADLERAASALGFARPDCAASTVDERIEDLVRLTVPAPKDGAVHAGLDGPPSWNRWVQGVETGDYLREFGYGPCETTAFLSFGRQTEVASLSVDRTQIETAVTTDPAWSDALTEQEHEGISYWWWGEKPEFERGLSAPRPIGIGGGLAVTDGVAVRAVTEAELQEVLGVAAGSRGLLEANPAIAEALDILDEAGAYSFGFQLGVVRPAGALADRAGGSLATPALVSYRSMVFGVAYDGASFVSTLVLVHADADRAAQNVERMKTTLESGQSAQSGIEWSEFVVLDEAVTADNLAIFTLRHVPTEHLRAGRPELLLSVVIRQDSLLWVEE